ncbi:MAG: DUF4923 family protein [Bacteroides sp.]|nr:DUF4923 family protein [Bacteroides sp.]MCM1095243.1 DUF4923 family protein [Terasakiella sp.]
MKHLLLRAALLAAIVASPALPARADNPLGKLGDIISGLTSKEDFDISSLQGTWAYTSPAVTLKSGNVAGKIGGTAASAAVESKIAPYFKRLGLDKTKITFDAEGGFSIDVRGRAIKGTVERPDSADTADGTLIFNFGKSKIGRVTTHVTKSATGDLTVTFDASKFVEIVQKVASVSGNSSLQTLSKMLSSYDGIYVGARLKKQK